ncbi:hypothetical protein BOX15_Mlig009737g2 [Macrostomum lignano]|uniref:Ras-related protein Rab-35 n=1 Tax=Macrostomum lignano TaxID=282301 RepID=A0A267GCN0_9PLAT|nr:hypothetical protein BOX15_Mlig009737g2 [Macrostomum lignano]
MSSPDYHFLFKLLIIGDSGVGKSALLLRYTDDTFSSNYITTIGVDFKIKTLDIDGVRVKLQIWDTAGQERFRTITATYYRGAHGIIVVFDVNSGPTFANVKRWFEEINHNCPSNVSKLLVGNKNDSPETKAVATSDLKTVANEYGVLSIETSAKDNVNVDLMFRTITSEILKTKGAQSAASDGGGTGGGVRITRVSPGQSSKKKCC